MGRGGMSLLRRRSAKIVQNEDPDAGGEAGLRALPVDLRADVVQAPGFAIADFGQGIPHLRFQTNTGPPIRERHITANESRHTPPKESLKQYRSTNWVNDINQQQLSVASLNETYAEMSQLMLPGRAPRTARPLQAAQAPDIA